MRILVVTTSNALFEGEEPHPTGVWLSEFTEPYMEFLSSGAELVVASPKGGPMPIDPRTNPTPEQQQAWKPALDAAASTLPLGGLTADSFDAIFLPGGHGPMFDLPQDPNLARLLEAFFAQGKIIAAVCHGPCGLVKARRPNGDPLVKGVTLTSYTYQEEEAAKLDAQVPFILENRLRELGANFIARENKADHVERDGQFVTGQNPNSSASLARSVVAALRKSFQPMLNVSARAIVPSAAVVEFPINTFLENLAVNPAGDIFIASYEESKIYRVSAGVASVAGSVPKPAGLAFDSDGSLLVASSLGSPTPGIYRLNPDGSAAMAVAMPDALFLNGLIHFAGSRFLAADSYRGLIWEIDASAGRYDVWIAHAALANNADPFHPLPQYFPGVNGLKIFEHALYASSTQQMKLIRIPLSGARAPGEPEVWMSNLNLDDFAFDREGNLYGTTHIYNSVVRIDRQRRVTVIAGLEEGVAGSTAVAFGRTAGDRTALYITTNGGMSVPPEGGVQPGRLVRLEVGIPGYEREA